MNLPKLIDSRCAICGVRPHLLAAALLTAASLAVPPGVQAQSTPPAGQSSGESAEDYARDPNRQKQLSADAVRLTLSGNIYFYQGGYFYRQEDDGYLRVEPPLGAELTFLPYGSQGFEIDGRRFFLSGTGTFYRYEPRRRSYVVTTPPYEWRRYYNGDLVGAYEDRLYGDPDLELENLRDRSGIPRAYPPVPPSGARPDGMNSEPLQGDGYRDPRRRDPSPYANIRPRYDANGERYDNRALAESLCRQDATSAAQRGSSLDRQRLRIYQREYRDCIQRYDRQR